MMVVAALAVTVKAEPPYTVVAGGLANPRGLTFGPGGRLYVAQAGTGDYTGKFPRSRSPRPRTPGFATSYGPAVDPRRIPW